jgi:hypothetical protein
VVDLKVSNSGRGRLAKQIDLTLIVFQHRSAAPPRVAGPFNSKVAPVDKPNFSYGRGVLSEGFSFWKKVTRSGVKKCKQKCLCITLLGGAEK